MECVRDVTYLNEETRPRREILLCTLLLSRRGWQVYGHIRPNDAAGYAGQTLVNLYRSINWEIISALFHSSI